MPAWSRTSTDCAVSARAARSDCGAVTTRSTTPCSCGKRPSRRGRPTCAQQGTEGRRSRRSGRTDRPRAEASRRWQAPGGGAGRSRIAQRIRGLVAGRTGLEPATSGVTGRCSNQLNYRPPRTRERVSCRNSWGTQYAARPDVRGRRGPPEPERRRDPRARQPERLRQETRRTACRPGRGPARRTPPPGVQRPQRPLRAPTRARPARPRGGSSTD